MIVIAMGQMLMSFNVAALPVSMSGMVESFNTPPTTVGTAIVMYSLGVSGFVMLGAKLGQRFGSKIFFQVGGRPLSGGDGDHGAQPDRDRDARGPGARRICGSFAGALAGRAHRQPLSGKAAGEGGRVVGLGAGDRRGAGVRHCRLRGPDQLATGLRPAHHSRRRHPPPQLQAQTIPAQAGGEDRRHGRDPGRRRRSSSSPLASTTSGTGACCWPGRRHRSTSWACRPRP